MVASENPPPGNEPDKEYVLAAYERASSLDDTFIEWRHKILTLLTTFVALTFAAERYLKTNDPTDTWLAGVLGAFFGVVLIVMDYRNNQIINGVRQVAHDLEVHGDVSGPYSNFPKARWKWGLVSYTWTIRLLGVAYAAASIYLAVIWTGSTPKH